MQLVVLRRESGPATAATAGRGRSGSSSLPAPSEKKQSEKLVVGGEKVLQVLAWQVLGCPAS